MMDALGSGLAAIVATIEGAHGDTTLVNGVVVQGALWAEAQAGRVQMFLSEDLEGKPAYDVTLVAAPFCPVIFEKLVFVRAFAFFRLRRTDDRRS